MKITVDFSKMMSRVQDALGGGDYARQQNAKVSPEMMAKLDNFNKAPLKRKIMTVGGYMLRKVKDLATGAP